MTDTSNVTNIHNGHTFVDLGLPSGLLWATCNVGATSPEQAGLYFAWGETEGFTAEQIKKSVRRFIWKTYMFHKNNLALLSTEDAAHTCMGGSWRMPTDAEIQELLISKHTVCKWTADYDGTGVKGYAITSKTNGNSIFLPAAGVAYGNGIHDVNTYGNYRSSTGNNQMYSLAMYFHKRMIGMNCEPRYYGFPVRAVCEM